ncbi:hypothetical protein [Metabacillus litoralis]|uniref:hypothetical protein n=1 Tax=Metabacillus litoralis TaxID=152268 RepID=UPI001CFC5747|nr:hypothetical protein [Metabacillus litoralis]
MFNKENKIAVLLTIIGWIEIVGGLVCGINFSSIDNGFGEEFILSIFLMWTSAGIISGVLFLALAEIVEFLNNIRDSLRDKKPITEHEFRDQNKDQASNNLKEYPTKTGEWSITEKQQQAIYKLYSGKHNIKVISTPYRNFCIVEIERDKIDIIEFNQNGFPYILADFHWKEIQKEIKQWYKEHKC